MLAFVAIHQIQSQKWLSIATSVSALGVTGGAASWRSSRNRYSTLTGPRRITW
jgi:hypothetical protein